MCGEALCFRKAKGYNIGSISIKAKIRAFRNGNQKIAQIPFHNHYCLDGHLGINNWDFTLFEQEIHKQMNDRETF